MSLRPFEDFFSWPYEIRIAGGQTSGYYDPVTAVWTPPATTGPTVIKGHFSRVDRAQYESNWNKTAAGPIETGDVRFYTHDAVKKGDLLEVDQDEAGDEVRTYRILGVVKTHTLMARYIPTDIRYECEIQEVPA